MLMHTIVGNAIEILWNGVDRGDPGPSCSCNVLKRAALPLIMTLSDSDKYDFVYALKQEYIRVTGALPYRSGFGDADFWYSIYDTPANGQKYRMEMLYYFYMSQSPMDGME